jgi:riboflavin synthase
MFTGIVQGLCEVRDIKEEPKLRRLVVDVGPLTDGAKPGASVAVNGTCLTVTAKHDDDRLLAFDVIQESLERTNLGRVIIGGRVNVERSLRFGDEIGGHILSGHVSDTVKINRITKDGHERVIWFDVDPRWMPYLPYKGFVALDGASLTISGVDRDAAQISVSLIPETIARTTLGEAAVGDLINLEIDAQTQAIVESVERLLPDLVGAFSVSKPPTP